MVGVSMLVLAGLGPVLVGQAGAAPLQTAAFDFGGLARTYVVHVPAGVAHPSGLVARRQRKGLRRRIPSGLS